MGLVASLAARSGIIAVAVFLLFVAAGATLMDAPPEYRLRAIERLFTDIPVLTTVAVGWLALVGWLWLERRKPPSTQHGRLAGLGWAAMTAALAAAGIVAIYVAMGRAFGEWWAFHSSWRYWLRLFEAALFAVAIVRIALPLLPRFDRMASHGK